MLKLTANVVCLGNIWEYPRALVRFEGVRVAGLLYEGEADAEDAIRVGRQTGARTFRVAEDGDVAEALRELGAGARIDLGIIANFGIILSEATLALAKEGFINFHPGILPGQAGREPVTRLWGRGGGDSGLTIHRAIAKPDAGPVLASVPYRVDAAQSIDENIRSIFRLGLPHLERVIFPL